MLRKTQESTSEWHIEVYRLIKITRRVRDSVSMIIHGSKTRHTSTHTFTQVPPPSNTVSLNGVSIVFLKDYHLCVV